MARKEEEGGGGPDEATPLLTTSTAWRMTSLVETAVPPRVLRMTSFGDDVTAAVRPEALLIIDGATVGLSQYGQQEATEAAEAATDLDNSRHRQAVDRRRQCGNVLWYRDAPFTYKRPFF